MKLNIKDIKLSLEDCYKLYEKGKLKTERIEDNIVLISKEA